MYDNLEPPLFGSGDGSRSMDMAPYLENKRREWNMLEATDRRNKLVKINTKELSATKENGKIYSCGRTPNKASAKRIVTQMTSQSGQAQNFCKTGCNNAGLILLLLVLNRFEHLCIPIWLAVCDCSTDNSDNRPAQRKVNQRL